MLSGHPHHLLVLKANQQARISVLPPTNALQQPIGVSTQSQEPFWWEQFRKSYTQHQYQHWWSEEKTVPLHMWVQSPRHVFLVHISIILLFFFPHSPVRIWKPFRHLQQFPVIRDPSGQQITWMCYIRKLGMSSLPGRVFQWILSRAALLHTPVVPRLFAAVLADRDIRIPRQH